MKRFSLRVTALLACACLLAASLCLSAGAEEASFVDYAASVSLDLQSETVKQEVTVRTFVDGDTTHFNVPVQVDPSGVIKARYLAINTPESTGKIEEWGKKASRFTKEALQSADSIIIESNDAQWNLDSTAGRDLVWVWYRPRGEAAYRNLNIELLQNGLALANSASQTRYGEACLAASMQAQALKLCIFSGQKDPDYYYGSAIELTIRELRLHPEEYDGKKVAFSGVVTVNHNNSVFIEDYDEETGLYFGFSAYYGFNLSGGGLEVLHVGNEVRIVGTVQYYEAGHVWQVSGLNYRMMKPKDPGNIQKLSEGNQPSWKETSPETLSSTVTLISENGDRSVWDYGWLAQGTTVEMKNLTVSTVGDGLNESTHWLMCRAGGDEEVSVYVPSRPDEGDSWYDLLLEKTIDIRGVVEYDGSEYYVRVYTPDALTIHQD